ncbi:DUF559 domain-containing protein [Prescottella agglutinans]|uniref:DUF559 domain-containing protein n=1 Tax=Prescottella agglutinans TaxID=1644129 RepID=A0ABT6M4P4_9NOCA|nr:DUF559 domain-containing protein [Prescottella agglutinans]MDH6278849.1 hypothetical protein [Prescottella agglutinans]
MTRRSELPEGPIRRSRLLETLTPSSIAREYVPVLNGIYVRVDQPVDFAQRSRALAVAHPDAVLAGWSAAALHGYRYIPDDAQPEAILPHPARRRAGVRFRYGRLAGDEHEDVYGYELTSHLRTAYDLGRRLPFDDAVAAVDGLCNSGLKAPKLIGDLIDRHRGDRGLKQLRRVLDLADAGADSPWETRTRLLIVRAGLPRPQTQYTFTDNHGAILSMVDMAWPQYRVVLEYDGDHHRERRQYALDVRRRARVRQWGWDVVVATKELVLFHPDELLARLTGALRQGGMSAS